MTLRELRGKRKDILPCPRERESVLPRSRAQRLPKRLERNSVYLCDEPNHLQKPLRRKILKTSRDHSEDNLLQIYDEPLEAPQREHFFPHPAVFY